MMTRKDYVETANILSGYKNLIEDEIIFEDLVNDFADMFAKDNERFNRDRFESAVFGD